MIKKGSISKEVISWQTFLLSKGFAIGGADGIFGEKTDQFTREWQKDNGLDPDGIVGKETYKAAAKQGYTAPKELWYPPLPDFSSPGREARKKMFGSFDWKPNGSSSITILGDWVKKNIKKVEIPQLLGVEGAPKNVVRFHKKGEKAIKGFFKEAEDEGLIDLVILWSGSFVPRRIRGRNALSNHAWGTAFDINAPYNWLNQEPAAVGKKGTLLKLVPIANKWGFFWGGHYRNRKDGMHFELARI